MEEEGQVQAGIPDACLLVGGQPRSGTTLLSSILRATPTHFQAFELHMRKPSFVVGLDGRYTRNIFSQLGLPPDHYDATVETHDTKPMNLGSWVGPVEEVSAEPASGGETSRFREELRARAELVSTLMRETAAVAAAESWGFKILGDIVHMPEYAHAWPNARVVVLVRDPRDQISSVLALNEGRRARGQAPFYPDVTAAAEGWVRTYTDGTAALQSAGTPHVILRYEDLVDETAATVDRLGDWLSLDLRAGLDFKDHSFVADHQSRFAHHPRLTQPIDQSSVGRWRTALSEDQVADILMVTTPLMTRFGYTP